MTKAEVQQYIGDIEKRVAARSGADMASVIALNELLTLPNAHEIFDDELKGAVRDLWVSLKSYGIELADPPLLFGLPKGFGEDDSEEIENSLEAAAANLTEEARVDGREKAPKKDEGAQAKKK